jgi:hypothetical protein
LGPVFMFCAPELVFGGNEGVGSRFHVLRSWNNFRRYRGRRVLLACFARPNTFLAVQRGVGSRFNVVRARTRFRRSRGRRVPFSCSARPDTFSSVTRETGPVIMFCAPGLIFGGKEGGGSRFHVMLARTRFQKYRGRRVPFSCLRVQTNSRRYRGRRVRFECFARLDLFSTVPRASGPVFLLCAPGRIFGGTEGVGSRFLVLLPGLIFIGTEGDMSCFPVFARADSFSAVPRASGPVFLFCTPGLVFGGIEGDWSRFHVLRARTRFRR